MRTDDEVRSTAAALVAAFASGDVRAYFGYFAADARFVFYTTAQTLGSRAEYEAEWSRWEREDGFRVLACDSSEQHVQDLGTVAVFTHRVHTRIATHEGEAEVHERETIVFRRDDGRWSAIHEHLSPLPEAVATD